MRASPGKTALVFAAGLVVRKPAWAATPKVGVPGPALIDRTLDMIDKSAVVGAVLGGAGTL